MEQIGNILRIMGTQLPSETGAGNMERKKIRINPVDLKILV